MDRRAARRFLLLAIAISLGCGGESPTDINYANLSLVVIAGNAQADTVTKRLPDALMVRVTESGEPRAGVLINFVVVEEGCGAAFAPSVQTNDAGDAQNFWDLGTLAGPCSMEARAIDANGNPVTFGRFTATAIPGTATQFSLPDPLVLWDTETVSFAADAVQDSFGNEIVYSVTLDDVATAAGARSISGSPWGNGLYHIVRSGVRIGSRALVSYLDPESFDGWAFELTCQTADTLFRDILSMDPHKQTTRLTADHADWPTGTRVSRMVTANSDTLYWSRRDTVDDIFTVQALRLKRFGSMRMLRESEDLGRRQPEFPIAYRAMVEDGRSELITGLPQFIGLINRASLIWRDTTVVQACISDGFIDSTQGTLTIEPRPVFL